MRRALLATVLALSACNMGPAEQGEPRPPPPGFITLSLPAYFDCLRERQATIVSAHRGGPAPGLAENALATLEHTMHTAPLRFALVFLEVDVAQTRDGVLVLMHDDTVDRTTNGSGLVSSLTLPQLKALRLEDQNGALLDDAPPTLREALDWAGGQAVLELDIKRGVAYENIVREVDAAGAIGRVVFITYNIDSAARLARLAPEAMIYTTISSERELDALERRDVDLRRIVAWTGADTPAADLVEALAVRGVEARFGMFGEGRDYANAARARAQIVAVDDITTALRDLDAADGEEGYAAQQCMDMQ